MKYFLSVVCIVMLGWQAAAQTAAPKGHGKITGSVIDGATQQPVEFATVALLATDSDKPIDGAVADDKGKFTINKVANGKYRVVISFIGYSNSEIKDITITDRKSNVDIGTIKLAPENKQLDEVVVEAQRELVEEKVDRTVYNAENDQTSKGGDGTDVLKRVPMLSVDMDGNVSLRGNSNVRVLINNKPSTITASSVADALKQIPADQIKSVEVITSPSAKYDAEGSAGIINIITKKNNLQGLTLNVDGSAGYRGSNLSLGGNYRKGKMGFSLGGFGRSGYNVLGKFSNSQTTISAPNTSLNNQSADTRRNDLFGNLNFGWDYDINKNNSLAANVRFGSRNNFNYQDNLFTETFLNSVLDTTTLSNVNVTDQSNNVDASLTYTHTFEKPQKEFSFMTQFSRNNRTNDFLNTSLNESDLSYIQQLKNLNKSYNQEVTFQADYQTPISTNQMLEFGGKNINREVSSDYKYLLATGNSGNFVTRPSANLTNIFNYSQNVSSGYLSYTYSFGSGYSIKGGSRYEYTTINANFANEKNPTEIPSYGVLVPSLNISKKLKSGGTLKLAYNRRIQRPSIQFLNPNIQASNRLNATQGNPTLGPEYTNNYELSYSTFVKSTSLNFSVFVRNTDNAIQSIRDVKNDTIFTNYRNIGKEDAYGGSVFANVNINKLTVNGGSDFYYAVLNNNDPDPTYSARNEGWVVNYRLFGSYSLTKGWGFQFFSFVRGRQVNLQGFQGSFYVYSLSLRKELANKKGSVGVGAEQFFTPTMRIENTTTSPLIQQKSVNEMYNLNFKITFSYRIGKMSFDSRPRRRRGVENDDLKEGGEGGGGGDMGQGGQGGQGGGQRGGGTMPAIAGGQRAGATTQPAMPAANPAAEVKAEGTWAYTVESPQGGGGKLIIRKEGDKYAGTIISSRNNREVPLTSVTLNGNEITCIYEVNFGGNTATIQLKGIIDGNAMTGSLTMGQFGAFPMKGTREQ